MNENTIIRNRITSIVLLILLCLVFMLAGRTVLAAPKKSAVKAKKESSGPQEITRLKKTPYISGGNKLTLRFADFSSNGYTYTVKNMKSGKTCSGTLASNRGTISVDLKGQKMYSKNTGYILEIVSKDGKKKATTRYYTASALKDISVTFAADNGLIYSWKVGSKTAYSGFLALASKQQNPSQAEVCAFVTEGTKKIPASKFSAGKWYCSGIAYRVIGNYKYYGERIVKKITYSKGNVGKVSGLSAKEGAHSAYLSWDKVSGASWYTVYMKKGSGKYKLFADNIRKTSFKATGLRSRQVYSFSVRAVKKDGSANRVGAFSASDTVETPKAAPDISKIVPAFNGKNELSVKWNPVKGAKKYWVYARKTGSDEYKLIGKTKETIFSLKDLDKNTSWDIIAYTVSMDKGKKYRSPLGSNVVTLVPSQYVKDNYTQLLASKVRTIGYHRYSCDYTTKKYSKDVKLAYVNYKGFTSKTPYLIWVSHYTQQTTIFKGSKGKWKIIRSFTVGTGKASTHSPRGIFKIRYKESGWYYTNTMELYVSHYAGRNSFHTRPLYRGGGVATATIGRPCSHGCVRCYNQDARYIYKNIPVGTTVVSY